MQALQAAISNPPFNIKWTPPLPLEADIRFVSAGIPPANNANYAFVLHILANIENKAVIILPNGIMCPNDTTEQNIIKRLVDNGHIEYVISMPDRMFESTSISTCVLGIRKNPVEHITFIDHRNIYSEEISEQRGQYGGDSHTNRTYKKIVKTLTDKMVDDVHVAIAHKSNKLDYCKTVPLSVVASNEYTLQPSRYVEYEPKETERRTYKEIHHDLCRVLSVKNSVKITCNETIARSIGLVNSCEIKCDPVEHVGDLLKQNTEKEGTFDSIMAIIGCEPLPRDNYLTFSKNKNEIKIENKGDGVDILIADFLRFWSVRIRELNIEENTYLAELRDKLCDDLMSGNIKIPEEK